MPSANAVRAGRAYVELFVKGGVFEQQLRGCLNKIKEFGELATKAGQVGITIAFSAGYPLKKLIDDYAKFDDSMRVVRAVTQGTMADFEKLTKLARRLGAETSFTAQQAAEGMVSLGRAGFSVQEIKDATGAVLDLARSTAVDLSRAAEIAAVALRDFGMESSDMTRVADVLSVTANGSMQTLEDLGEALKIAAPVAQNAKMSFEDLAKTFGFLANMGLKGSIAATGFRNIITRMSDTKVQDIYKQYGVSVIDPNTGELRNFITVMEELSDALRDMPSGEKLGVLKELFSKFGLASGGALTSGAEFERLFRDIDNASGRARQVAKEMDEGIGGSLRLSWSKVKDAFLEVGKTIAPTLQELLERVEQYAKAVKDFMHDNEAVIKNLMEFGTAVAEVVGKVLKFFAQLFLNFPVFKELAAIFVVLSPLLLTVGLAMKGLAAVFGGFWVVLRKVVNGLGSLRNYYGNFMKNITGLTAAQKRYNQANLDFYQSISNLQNASISKQNALTQYNDAAAKHTQALQKYTNAEMNFNRAMYNWKMAGNQNAQAFKKSMNDVTKALKARTKAQIELNNATQNMNSARTNWYSASSREYSAKLDAVRKQAMAHLAYSDLQGTTQFYKIINTFSTLMNAAMLGLMATTATIAVANAVINRNLNKAIKAYEEATKKLDTFRQGADQDNKLIAELEELSNKNELNNREMDRAVSIINILSDKYDGLGVSVDRTTGKIIGLADAQKKIQKQQIQDEIKYVKAQLQAKYDARKAMFDTIAQTDVRHIGVLRMLGLGEEAGGEGWTEFFNRMRGGLLANYGLLESWLQKNMDELGIVDAEIQQLETTIKDLESQLKDTTEAIKENTVVNSDYLAEKAYTESWGIAGDIWGKGPEKTQKQLVKDYLDKTAEELKNYWSTFYDQSKDMFSVAAANKDTILEELKNSLKTDYAKSYFSEMYGDLTDGLIGESKQLARDTLYQQKQTKDAFNRMFLAMSRINEIAIEEEFNSKEFSRKQGTNGILSRYLNSINGLSYKGIEDAKKELEEIEKQSLDDKIDMLVRKGTELNNALAEAQKAYDDAVKRNGNSDDKTAINQAEQILTGVKEAILNNLEAQRQAIEQKAEQAGATLERFSYQGTFKNWEALDMAGGNNTMLQIQRDQKELLRLQQRDIADIKNKLFTPDDYEEFV